MDGAHNLKQMTTNKELIRQLAEEMAFITYHENYGCQDNEPDEWEAEKQHWIEMHMPLAERIVVPFGAKMFKEGYNFIGTPTDCILELKERGLIAEKEGKDE